MAVAVSIVVLWVVTPCGVPDGEGCARLEYRVSTPAVGSHVMTSREANGEACLMIVCTVLQRRFQGHLHTIELRLRHCSLAMECSFSAEGTVP
jgi:hypothetical protein